MRHIYYKYSIHIYIYIRQEKGTFKSSKIGLKRDSLNSSDLRM